MKERQRTCPRPNRFGQWSLAAGFLLLAWAAPGGLHAQSWSGRSALGIQIRGAGGPVAGAIVEIRRQGPGFSVGPESRKTDSRGQANFVGITQGRWNLEIKHPDYLSFVASINVQPGKKPAVLTQFLEASGPGRGTFRVKFLRTDQSLGEVIPGTAASEPATDRPVSVPAPGFDRSTVEKAEPSERVASRAVPTQIIAPVPQPVDTPVDAVDPVEPAAETPEEETSQTELEAKSPKPTAEVPVPLDPPTAQPVASPTQQPVTAPPAPMPVDAPSGGATAPVPEPQPQSASQSGSDGNVPTPDALPESEPMDTPSVSPSEQTQEPTQEPAKKPAPVPTPTLPEPEAPQPDIASTSDLGTEAPPPTVLESSTDSLRAYRDRSCFECKPGEWAVAVELDVPSGDTCRTTAEVAVRRALRDVAAAASEQLADFSGPLPLDLAVFPLSVSSVAARNTLAPYLEPTASCRFLAIVVPEGGRFTGFRFEALDANASGSCTGEEECEIGHARFLFSPGIARGVGASIVYSVFENTGGTDRIARMTGFFLPANGWAPN